MNPNTATVVYVDQAELQRVEQALADLVASEAGAIDPATILALLLELVRIIRGK